MCHWAIQLDRSVVHSINYASCNGTASFGILLTLLRCNYAHTQHVKNKSVHDLKLVCKSQKQALTSRILCAAQLQDPELQ